MRKLNIVSQKLNGKTQQVKGKFENATGQQIRGNIDILKGKSNELAADVKMKISNNN